LLTTSLVRENKRILAVIHGYYFLGELFASAGNGERAVGVYFTRATCVEYVRGELEEMRVEQIFHRGAVPEWLRRDQKVFGNGISNLRWNRQKVAFRSWLLCGVWHFVS
jgi:hypothetical protein